MDTVYRIAFKDIQSDPDYKGREMPTFYNDHKGNQHTEVWSVNTDNSFRREASKLNKELGLHNVNNRYNSKPLNLYLSKLAKLSEYMKYYINNYSTKSTIRGLELVNNLVGFSSFNNK